MLIYMYTHAYDVDWNISHKLSMFNQIFVSINPINKFNISLILAIIRSSLLLLQIYKKFIICQREQTLLDQHGTKE